ncbi:hypothetical protein KKG24_02705 [Patescibacteria group bacterium]|nr:hypothetical protein [Patescibacteria group bacterium]
MKLNFIHVCDTAFLSQDNKLNIIGIFEAILTPSLPAVHSRLTIVANIEGSLGMHDFDIAILDPADKKIGVLSGKFNLDAVRKKFGIINTINNLQLTSEGVYSVILSVDSRKLGETNFEIRKIGAIS